ncbi:hypothetical protein BC830DRAFT_1130736 [Chytriomyces sp. MP71]|nr:hypothetical protein BC830DRAFT_1130736 [Chytriomyces sp. MP71]
MPPVALTVLLLAAIANSETLKVSLTKQPLSTDDLLMNKSRHRSEVRTDARQFVRVRTRLRVCGLSSHRLSG